MIPYIVILVVLPFGPTLFALNLDIGIFFVMAMSSVSVIGVLMAGWSSREQVLADRRAARGRAADRLRAAAGPGRGRRRDAGRARCRWSASSRRSTALWNIVRPCSSSGSSIFVMASLAELTRPPFDMPVADSEIIFGAYTEYTGLKFAFFLLAEYGGHRGAVGDRRRRCTSAGTCRSPGCRRIPGPFWMLGKIVALSFVVIWLRATYPRLREDQLQRFSWVRADPARRW